MRVCVCVCVCVGIYLTDKLKMVAFVFNNNNKKTKTFLNNILLNKSIKEEITSEVFTERERERGQRRE